MTLQITVAQKKMSIWKRIFQKTDDFKSLSVELVTGSGIQHYYVSRNDSNVVIGTVRVIENNKTVFDSSYQSL